MNNVNILSKSKVIPFAVLFIAAFFAPFLQNQLITGPIVNAILFISTMVLGVEYAIFIGLFPSLVSIASGLLPVVLAPVIPFIMVSNALLILSFSFFRNRFWQGIVVSSVLKFLFLVSTTSLVTNLVVKKEIASKIILMMSWPQLATALVGGVIAYIILKVLKYEV